MHYLDIYQLLNKRVLEKWVNMLIPSLGGINETVSYYESGLMCFWKVG